MAAISLSCCLLSKIHEIKERRIISIPRTPISMTCQSSKSGGQEDSNPMKEKGEKPLFFQAINEVLKLGKGLKENLSPKQKGDWKDLLLMSFSFAVYVYMSQKIVCAYCAWMSMLKQPW